MITTAVSTIRSLAMTAVRALAAHQSTGSRTADRRPPGDAPAPVEGAEGPRTRVGPGPAAAGVMDFGTRGQRDGVRQLNQPNPSSRSWLSWTPRSPHFPFGPRRPQASHTQDAGAPD